MWFNEGVKVLEGNRWVEGAVMVTDEGLTIRAERKSVDVEAHVVVDVWVGTDCPQAVAFQTDSSLHALLLPDPQPLLSEWEQVLPLPRRNWVLDSSGQDAGPCLPSAALAEALGESLSGPGVVSSPRRGPAAVRYGPPAPPGAVVIEERTVLRCEEADVTDIVPPGSSALPVRAVMVPGKGRGLVATRDFSSGEDIWKEYPRMTMVEGGEKRAGGDSWREEELRKFVLALDARDDLAPHDSIQAGVQCGEGGAPAGWHRRFARVVLYNSWGFSVTEEEHCKALFGLGSLVNHSCSPNARYDTKDGREYAVFRAIRPISRGEEVTVSYTQHLTRERAQKELVEEKGFLCRCRRCERPDDTRRVQCVNCKVIGGVMPQPPDWRRWVCEACGAPGEGMVDRAAQEAWLLALAEDHSQCDYSAEHHVALLHLVCDRLSPQHCAAAVLCEQILQLSHHTGITSEGFLACARLLISYARQSAPDTWTCRPSVAQALGQCIKGVQQTGDAIGAVRIAQLAAEALGNLRGEDDDDVVALRRIGGLQC
eukprot:Hpha_TRINITY_DN19289_c0_g1::TRINITY_DN19289_c0_g1_i1::g.194258::m.194258